MSNELKSVLDAAMSLNDRDRAMLVDRLLDSLPEDSAVDPDDEFVAELDRRFAEGIEATVNWEDIKDEL